MDITRKSIELKIKIPYLLLLIHPYALITTEEELNIKSILSEEEREMCLTFENIKNEIINLKFKDLIIDSNYDMEIINTNENFLSRLNFLENKNNEIYKNFPFTYIIIPQNEIIKENSFKLFDFLK